MLKVFEVIVLVAFVIFGLGVIGDAVHRREFTVAFGVTGCLFLLAIVIEFLKSNWRG